MTMFAGYNWAITVHNESHSLSCERHLQGAVFLKKRSRLRHTGEIFVLDVESQRPEKVRQGGEGVGKYSNERLEGNTSRNSRVCNKKVRYDNLHEMMGARA